MSLKAEAFFKAANPDGENITEAAVDAQFRNFVEEIQETFSALQTLKHPGAESARQNIVYYLTQLQNTEGPLGLDLDSLLALDGLCDIAVAGQGLAYVLGYDYVGAKDAVDESNLSKVVDGAVIRTASGKIAKPASYVAPDLTPFI